MEGVPFWYVVCGLLTILVVLTALPVSRGRPWTYRILLMLGSLSFVWFFISLMMGIGLSPVLMLCAIIAFAVLCIVDTVIPSLKDSGDS